jgi:hypothetical protein
VNTENKPGDPRYDPLWDWIDGHPEQKLPKAFEFGTVGDMDDKATPEEAELLKESTVDIEPGNIPLR